MLWGKPTVAMMLLGNSRLIRQEENLSPPLPSIVRQQWRALRLARKREDGFHFVGTGFVVKRSDKTYVVTCAHLAEAALVAKNSEADLALLAVDVSISGSTQPTTIDVREGTEVFVVGFNDQHRQKDNPQIQSEVITTVGWWEDRGYRLFTSRRTTVSAPHALLISGSNCQPGESGSLVFRSKRSDLSLTTSFTHDYGCLATAIPALVDLLEPIEPFE